MKKYEISNDEFNRLIKSDGNIVPKGRDLHFHDGTIFKGINTGLEIINKNSNNKIVLDNGTISFI